MALNATGLKKKMETRILNGLKSAYAGTANGANSKDDWAKLAKVISGIAEDIVLAITTEAEVAPGIAATGASPSGPVTTTSTSPGKIL